MSSHTAREPEKVRAYFAAVVPGHLGHARVAQTFVPGVGWRNYPIAKRISPSWGRRMRADGVTAVALSRAGHVADFQIGEVTQ